MQGPGSPHDFGGWWGGSILDVLGLATQSHIDLRRRTNLGTAMKSPSFDGGGWTRPENGRSRFGTVNLGLEMVVCSDV